MTAGVLSRSRLAVPTVIATVAAALVLALGAPWSGDDDPIAAPVDSAPLADPYEGRTGAFPGAR
jgi:hypothetical protein